MYIDLNNLMDASKYKCIMNNSITINNLNITVFGMILLNFK